MLKKFNKFNNSILFEKVDDYVSLLMLDIHEELNNISNNDYFIDFYEKYGFTSTIHIDRNELKTISVYHAQISIQDIIRENFKKIDINIYIEDNDININKIYTLLAHEFSHYYQLISGEDKYFISINKMINIEDFKNSVKNYKIDFLNYIYYNFEHELDARVNMTYEGYLYSKLKTLEEMYDRFYENELYKMLIFLSNFNSVKMIKKYVKDDLLDLTNQFNLLYNINQIDISQLDKYYKNWENIFKENSIKYIEESKDAIKQAFSKQKRYEENYSYCYDETPLYENNSYNMDDEIMKLVNRFKKIPL